MSDNAVKPDIDALFEEGSALRDALLAHDLTEARFRSCQMADLANRLGLSQVAASALALLDVLGPAGAHPSPAYGEAVFALSDALDDAGKAAPGKTCPLGGSVGH